MLWQHIMYLCALFLVQGGTCLPTREYVLERLFFSTVGIKTLITCSSTDGPTATDNSHIITFSGNLK
jgi:hypothetical protein